MNTAKVAGALNTISVAFGELAEALNESVGPERPAGPAAVGSPSTAPASLPPSIDELPFDDALIPDEFREPQPSLAQESVEFADPPNQLSGRVTPSGTIVNTPSPQGSEAVCPKHKTPYKEGRYGPFCTSPSDDPAWANRKGYCNITPKNAAQYLRVKAAA